jgi:archaellum biogenesis protein FlaJ (TadC family)
LKDELDYVTTKAFAAESLADALRSMSSRVKSTFLDRAMKLFASALRSGGKVAQLLEETGQDIAETRSLKKEMVTTTKTYTMFILFTVTFGAPVLLAISVHFLDVITKVQSNIGDVGFGMSGLMGEILITTSFLFKAAIVILLLTAIFASMLIGTIKEGKAKYGLKLAPVIIGMTFMVFIIARIVIEKVITGITF